MSRPNLIIGGIVVPHLGALQITQEYRPIESVARRRMGSGRLFQQTHWRKLATTINIPLAWIPPALVSVDWDANIQIACVAPRTAQSVANAITLPAARRSDAPIDGFAVVGNQLVATPLNLVGDVATLTAVAGATAYRVNYYPLLTCYASPPEEQLDAAGAVYGWRLEAEEI